MADEEEVLMELEAVQAVYGDDCLVLDSYPPHLHLRIKPRTADVSSQQVLLSLSDDFFANKIDGKFDFDNLF